MTDYELGMIKDIKDSLSFITDEDSPMWKEYPSTCRLILSAWEQAFELVEERDNKWLGNMTSTELYDARIKVMESE